MEVLTNFAWLLNKWPTEGQERLAHKELELKEI
jgi:hypothetical protein